MIRIFNSDKRDGPGKVSGLIRDGVQVLQSGANDLETAFCTYAFIYVAIRTGVLISIYYSFSIGLTFYQKWLIKVRTLDSLTYLSIALFQDFSI